MEYNRTKYCSSYEMKVFVQNLHLYNGLQNNKLLEFIGNEGLNVNYEIVKLSRTEVQIIV